MDPIAIFLISIALVVLFLLIAPIVFALIKKKYWIIPVEAVVVVLIVLCISLFPTRFPYVDSWIMGKTREEITSVYGEPTGYDKSHMISYYTGKDNGFFGIMSSNNDMHYYIHFDENGIAYEILHGCQLGG